MDAFNIQDLANLLKPPPEDESSSEDDLPPSGLTKLGEFAFNKLIRQFYPLKGSNSCMQEFSTLIPSYSLLLHGDFDLEWVSCARHTIVF